MMIHGSLEKDEPTDAELRPDKKPSYRIEYCPIVFVFSDDIDFLADVLDYVSENFGIPLVYSRTVREGQRHLHLRFNWRMTKDEIRRLEDYLGSLVEPGG